MDTKMYKKRSGTSGIRGHLYETKLLSLLLFRAINDEDIEEFYLGSNVDDIGAFDDICFKAKVKGFDRPIALFIQIKHRENNRIFTLENKNDLAKYFDSYRRIKNLFTPDNNDDIFKGGFDETECFFILYTNANAENTKEFEGNDMLHLGDKLHDLIGTGDDNASKIEVREKYIEFLIQTLMTEQMQIKTKILAEHLAKFIIGENNIENMFNDEIIVQYHLTLAKNVVLSSQIQPEGHRNVTFRNDFFDSHEQFNVFLKNALTIEMLKRKKVKKSDVENLLLQLSHESIDIRNEALLKLTESVVTFKDGKLKFVVEICEDLKTYLAKIDISHLNVEQAMETTAQRVLGEINFKVPAVFGNEDIYIRGTEKKVEKRLKYLETKMIELFNKSERDKIVIIDESIEEGLLRLNGGFAGAVGNLLVLDNDTKLLKFTDSCDLLGENSKTLFKRIKSLNDSFHEYRFVVKTEKFPKLSFSSKMGHEEKLALEFLDKLLFYSNQAEVDQVGKILKEEIEEKERNIVTNFRVKSDAIAIKFHDEIQKWWMTSKEAPYFLKESKVYDDVISSIIDDPLTSAMNIIYKNKFKGVSWFFNDIALEPLGLDIFLAKDNEDTNNSLNSFLPMIAILTKMIAFTVMKIFQVIKNKEIIVLDLDYILNLQSDDLKAIFTELNKINKNKIYLIVYDSIYKNRNGRKRFEKIANVINEKNMNVMVITNEKAFELTAKYFLHITKVVKDERNDLMDLSEDSYTSVLRDTTIYFQGQELCLCDIIDDESKIFVKVATLSKVYHDEAIIIGQSISNSKYEKIKDLYIDRRIATEFENSVTTVPFVKNGRISNKYIKSFDDIERHVVVLTATPGMGKSTLLTHLSVETKKLDPTVWIIRVNLLEHTDTFNQWQTCNIDINILEILIFLCKQILIIENYDEDDLTITLEQCDDKIVLKDCTGDEFIIFQLNIFLHFYNTRRMIFLFDGFDEITPHYITEVLTLIKGVGSNLRKHKMWIASRSYNDLTALLEREFGKSHTMDYFSYQEQETYLNKIWMTKLVWDSLKNEQRRNVYDFIVFMSEHYKRLKGDKQLLNLTILPILHIYSNAANYLIDIVDSSPRRVRLVKDLIKTNTFHNQYFNAENDHKAMCYFSATPLHLYVMADYFQSQIKGINRKEQKWDFNINTYTMYEHLLLTKLMKIRFEDKNAMILTKPDVRMTFEKERADFISMHKKLAAYALFHRDEYNFFDPTTLKHLKETIEKIKLGFEKTGLIYKITNNIPEFVHMTVAEYFTVEHICDMLKDSNSDENLKSLWDFILNVMFFKQSINVLNIMDHKVNYDNNLIDVLQKSKKCLYDLLIAQGRNIEPDCKIQSTITRAVSQNLRNFYTLFFSALESNLSEDDLDVFIKISNETNLFTYLEAFKFDGAGLKICNLIRRVDRSKSKSKVKLLIVQSDPACFDLEFAGTRMQVMHPSHPLAKSFHFN